MNISTKTKQLDDTDATDKAANANTKPTKAQTTDPAPSRLNDAVIRGTDTPEMQDLLQRQVTLMTGEMWGAKDHRNTQDEQWKPTEMSWISWIVGMEGDQNSAAWGFSRHPVGKDKEGSCIVLGSSIGKARKAKAMEYMHAMGIDIDSGARLDDVLAKIEKLGLFCLVYTSFNHGKSGLQLKRDEVLRKLQIKTDPTLQQVQQFLREHSKSRYEEDFIAEVEIVQAKKQVKEGVVIELATPPLEKFRLIFPLADAVKIIDLAETHDEALAIWEDKVTGLAVETLGVHFDISATDPSRLFFTARHPKDAEDWYCAVVQGRPLTFDEVPVYKKSLYASKRDKLNPFEMAGGGGDEADKPPMALTPNGRSLNEWHTKFKDRFMIANLLEDYCQDRIRVAGGESEGHVHTECPWEHEHSSEGGTATMAVNCIDSPNEYWTWFCHHDSCQGRHKLQFLEEALRQEWFDESLLTDMDAGYLLEGPDEESEEVRAERAAAFLERAGQFNKSASESAITNFIAKAFTAGVDLAAQARITDALAAATALTKHDIKRIWKACEADKKAAERAKRHAQSGGAAPIVNQDDFHPMCDYARSAIKAANAATPFLFHHIEELCEVTADANGKPIIKNVSTRRFANLLNSVTRFVRITGDSGNMVGVSAPVDVVSHVLGDDLTDYPSLNRIVTTPFFAADGQLVSEPGYHEPTLIYLAGDMSVFPRVSAVPTAEEVFEAKRLIVEEVLADFPLGALHREEIVQKALHGDGVPAVASVFAMLLLPFMREMIDGPTPGHLLGKPAPGTGASLLTDVISTIVGGRATPALAMPANKDELSKTLTSVMVNGQSIVFFDNINHSVDSGELASAMTTPTYQARVLGRSETVEVDVRCVWVFTGNNVTLSSELIRRCVFIPLDARTASPELRTGWRHDDIRAWTTHHRGQLVWACLTLIQNWIAQGCETSADRMASFETWAKTMGGVLSAAGIGGFLTDQQAHREEARDTATEQVQLLMDFLADEADGTVFRMTKPKSGGSVKAIVDILNGNESAGYEHDPILIPSWGFNRDEGFYTSTSAAGKKFRTYVKNVREGTDSAGKVWQLTFEEGWDGKAKQAEYTMTKKPA